MSQMNAPERGLKGYQMIYPHMGLNNVSADSNLESALGERVPGPDGSHLKLVKASADIATAAKFILVYTDTAATEVATSTTASDSKVAGIVPSGIVADTTTDGTIDSGEYFYVIVEGVATAVSAAAIADGAPIGVSATAGKIDDLSIAAGGVAAVALEAATGADEDVSVLLRL